MRSLFLSPQSEVGPSISSLVFQCSVFLLVCISVPVLEVYFCPSSVGVVATFYGTVLFPLFICSFTYLFIYLFICLFAYLFTYLFVYLLIYLLICLLIYLVTYLFVYLLIDLLIYLFIYLFFIYLFIYIRLRLEPV